MIKYRAILSPFVSLEGTYPKDSAEVIIVQYDDSNKNVWIPSSLTNFIYHKYNNKSLNTKMKVARTVCSFINYLYAQVIIGEDSQFEVLKERGLFGLNHGHLASYINYISRDEKRISYETVKDKENYLIKFYSFLNNRDITDKSAKINKKLIKSNDSNKRGQYVEISPFDESDDYTIKYPSKNKSASKVLKDMEEDVWNRFLEFAEEHYPNIALGVAFQCMGGLRMGEVVNLSIDSIETCKSQQHIKVEIDDRQAEFFRDRNVNELKSQTKKNRFNQPVFDFNGNLFDLLDKHMKNLANNPKVKNTSALFVNSQGNPMTGESYYRYFMNLKNDFLEFLENEGFAQLSNKLSKYKWGTHIGRHIFTNHLIKIGAVSDANGDPVAKYLMALRGDASERSSSVYIDTKAVIEVVIGKIDLMSRTANKSRFNKE